MRVRSNKPNITAGLPEPIIAPAAADEWTAPTGWPTSTEWGVLALFFFPVWTVLATLFFTTGIDSSYTWSWTPGAAYPLIALPAASALFGLWQLACSRTQEANRGWWRWAGAKLWWEWTSPQNVPVRWVRSDIINFATAAIGFFICASLLAVMDAHGHELVPARLQPNPAAMTAGQRYQYRVQQLRAEAAPLAQAQEAFLRSTGHYAMTVSDLKENKDAGAVTPLRLRASTRLQVLPGNSGWSLKNHAVTALHLRNWAPNRLLIW